MRKPTPEFLLIDIGNSRLKWAVAGLRGPIRVVGDIETRNVTSAWVSALSRKFSRQLLLLSSVVPGLIPTFGRAFAERLHVVNGTLAELELSFDYPNPAELGADRLAAAVSVHVSGHYPAIIVACGTATAFTVLDAKGKVCGGVIAPGMEAQLTALLGATAQLPATELSDPKRYLAQSTQEAIRAGLILNFRGGVKEIIQQLSKELRGHRKPHIILTGGNAPYLDGQLGFPVKLRPLLVLEGLLIIGFRLYRPV